MSKRYQGGVLGVGFNPLQAPNAPTIGTATAGDASASVAFTAPANVGGSAITSYAVQSTPSNIGATGASSPVTVSGLTNGTAYTFRVTALNSYGPSPASASSNSVTPALVQGQQAYTTAGTFSWVAPAGVTSVSVVAVGGGGRNGCRGAGGGALGYKNNYSVTPGSSYTVVVGAGGLTSPVAGGDSYFVTTGTVKGGGGAGTRTNVGGVIAAQGGTYTGDGGGNGGRGGVGGCGYAGGGAGGYSGAGGDGSIYILGGSGSSGNGGGGGGGGTGLYNACYVAGGAGGGVGILGQGTSGAGGLCSSCNAGQGGRGGSGGANGGGSNGSPTGGAYGGGSGGGYFSCGVGGVGAVRIIWPGTTRSFPSTNTGNL